MSQFVQIEKPIEIETAPTEEALSTVNLTSQQMQQLRQEYLKRHPVVVVGGARTPFVKAGGVYKDYGQLDLAIHSVQAALKRSELKESQIEEVVYGAVILDPHYLNLAREIVLRSDCLPSTIPAHFVSNNCITSLVAIDKLANDIALGKVRAGIAGGVESLSNPTLTFSRKAQKFFLELARAKSFKEKLRILKRWRPRFAFPAAVSAKEPSTGLTMGEHCELTAQELRIPRYPQDLYALWSHKKAAKAQEEGAFSEVEPFGGVEKDNLIRGDTSMDKLLRLKPVFDRESGRGTLTAGNSSPLTDGASAVCLMSEREASKRDKEILGYVAGVEFAAVDPSDGLLQAPVVALPKLLSRFGLGVGDIDLFEVHEAFAAQVLANQIMWERGWEKYGVSPIGRIPDEKLNVNGGSLALGHPFAATGARLLLNLVQELKRRDLNFGVISVCAAGAMACAMLVTRERPKWE
ncbi:MAG: acetyl-CoA C-acyltransferase [Candidatus Dadabacteria bacterium]|nr:MAG: acetyl-CoA C-acyltransferase [Candidatus Dadabacteria bacterium]